MTILYGYRVLILRTVYHNDKFIANLNRYETVHVRPGENPADRVVLKPGEVTKVSEELTVTVTDEHIPYDPEFLGRVVPVTIYEYVKDTDTDNTK